MEVTPEASTAMGMAFTSWGMSMGKVYEVLFANPWPPGPLTWAKFMSAASLRTGKFRSSFVQIGAWK